MEYSKTHLRPPGELDVTYTRRLEDPLEVAFADVSGRHSLMARDQRAITECLGKGKPEDVIEFVADYAYRSVGIISRKESQQVAAYGANLLQDRLASSASLTPRDNLRAQMRLLDFKSLAELSRFQAAKEHINATMSDPKERRRQESQALAELDKQTIGILRQSAYLLKEGQETYKVLKDAKARQDLYGQMFELLYTTHARYTVYQEELTDEQVVLGATAFEDNSARFFSPENHNYDVMSLNPNGEVIDLVQCKSAATDKVYKNPIRKVEGQAFGTFMRDPQKYIGAICVLADNGTSVSEQRMVASRQLLEGLFSDPVSPDLAVGRMAVAASAR